MNAPSSTIKAATGYSIAVGLALTAAAVFFPEYYARIPPGTEGYLVAAAAALGGYFTKEKVLK